MLRSVVMRVSMLVPMIAMIIIIVRSMMLVIVVIIIIVSSIMLVIIIVTSMRVTHIDQVGRNITRAFWDYYKIVAVIPLEVASTKLVMTDVFVFQDSSDDECGIPKPSRDFPGRPKSAAVTRSFNMDRLKEVERQRQQTAQTFDGEVGFNTN